MILLRRLLRVSDFLELGRDLRMVLSQIPDDPRIGEEAPHVPGGKHEIKVIGRITKEHPWPTSLHTRLQAANGASGSLFWLRRTNTGFAGEPTGKDVCQICNNGVMASRDACICELFDRYFALILVVAKKLG